MKSYSVATILWAVVKSLDKMITEIDMGQYEQARLRAVTTKVAINKQLGTEECTPVSRKHHPPHAAII
jgi:hypothetical protein